MLNILHNTFLPCLSRVVQQEASGFGKPVKMGQVLGNPRPAVLYGGPWRGLPTVEKDT